MMSLTRPKLKEMGEGLVDPHWLDNSRSTLFYILRLYFWMWEAIPWIPRRIDPFWHKLEWRDNNAADSPIIQRNKEFIQKDQEGLLNISPRMLQGPETPEVI